VNFNPENSQDAKKGINSHMLSGSEFDELDAQLEQFIMLEGEDLLVEPEAAEKSSSSLTPTQPNLLS